MNVYIIIYSLYKILLLYYNNHLNNEKKKLNKKLKKMNGNYVTGITLTFLLNVKYLYFIFICINMQLCMTNTTPIILVKFFHFF